MTKPNRGGRRAQASAKAMAALKAAGIDASAVDPRLILQSIAADTSAPASARVTACRLLMAALASEGARRSDPAAPASNESREWRKLVGRRK
jgi:hypothetical protein